MKEYGVPTRPDCETCRVVFRDLEQAEAHAREEGIDVIEVREVTPWQRLERE